MFSCFKCFTDPAQRQTKRFALCHHTVVCPVCLSVTLVYCSQTGGWIKMKLSMEVGLGPGHIMLDGDPAPPQKGHSPPPRFLAHVCCGQMAGWIEMLLGTEVGISPGHIVLDGTQLSPQKGGHSSPHLFGPCLLWPNGWMDQDTTCYGGRPRPRSHCVRWGPISYPPKMGHSSPPSYRLMSIVAIWLDGSRRHLVQM